ncbi:MAG: trypsin-like peptidase domain-containing protein, partial [Chromatiales bacterium]|nr:trypsin-like peptidase domain-containing protein [Chromatiales bacterium]
MTDSVARDFGRLHVVKITGTLQVSEGRSSSSTGTGFAIRKGVVATALHVVADRSCDPPALLHGLTLSFAECGSGNSINTFDVDSNISLLAYNVEEDWALLSFDSDRDYPLLVPCSRTSVGDEFFSHGFAHPDGQAMSGKFVGSAARKQRLLMQLRVDELTAATPGPVRGYSGAPVMVAQHVVGIITLRNPDRHGEDHRDLTVGATLFATPIAW